MWNTSNNFCSSKIIISSFYTSQSSTDQTLCFKSFIMVSYQSVVNINIIMKFLIGHKAFVSLCTTLSYITSVLSSLEQLIIRNGNSKNDLLLPHKAKLETIKQHEVNGTWNERFPQFASLRCAVKLFKVSVVSHSNPMIKILLSYCAAHLRECKIQYTTSICVTTHAQKACLH